MAEPSHNDKLDSISTERRTSLVDEVRTHNESARQLFSIFVTWWTFVCTANLTALGVVLARTEIHKGVAPAVAVFDLMGSGFCLILALRLVQIQDRVTAVLRALYGGSSPLRLAIDPLAAPSIPALIRRIFASLKPEPTGDPLTPGSPIPLGFYLWCIVPVMTLACPLIAGLWLVGWRWPHWLD